MEKKCSFSKHIDINAIYYCQECNVYMCNKCANYHSEFLENHHKYELGKEKKEIFTSFCKEKNHTIKLQFFCQTHNQLCCAACISKIKGEGNGQHSDCKVCFIKDIEEEKRNKLKDNIKYLENFSNNIDSTINELKALFEKINENKEILKNEITQIFTKIRNSINEREDQILLDIDKEFNNLFFKGEIIKESEKLPNVIKKSLELGKEINNKWQEDNNILSYINECINIENNINSINLIRENINNSSLIKNFIIKFEGKDEINNFINQIKSIGKIIKEKKNLFLNDSLIINNNINSIITLKNWINPNKNICSQLLYRLSRDGEEISKFHELCDNKGPTLTIFLVKDGNIGGIFTPLSWDIQSETKNDKESFMFNLNNNEKYTKIKDNISIFCTKDHGPWTYSFGFRKENKMKKVQHGGANINNGYKNDSNIIVNNSSKIVYFDINEVEVYKIIINN